MTFCQCHVKVSNLLSFTLLGLKIYLATFLQNYQISAELYLKLKDITDKR